MKARTILSWVFVACFGSAAVAQDTCDSVLQYTGLSTLRSVSTSESSDLDYYFNCTESGKSRSGNLGISYKALEVKIGGSKYTTENSCTEKLRTIDESKMQTLLLSQPFEAAITAWLSCKQASVSNLSVNMFDDPDAVGVKIENTTPGDLIFWVSGTRLSDESYSNVNEECTVVPPDSVQATDDSLIRILVPGNKFATISCTRTVITGNRDGIFTRTNPPMNIRIASSDVAPVSFPFVEKLLDPETVGRLDAAEAAIGQMSGALSGLSATIDGLGTRPDSTWVKSGAGQGGNFEPGNIQYPIGECPAGQYVAGLESYGANPSVGYCQGCLVGVKLLCKPLK